MNHRQFGLRYEWWRVFSIHSHTASTGYARFIASEAGEERERESVRETWSKKCTAIPLALFCTLFGFPAQSESPAVHKQLHEEKLSQVIGDFSLFARCLCFSFSSRDMVLAWPDPVARLPMPRSLRTVPFSV